MPGRGGTLITSATSGMGSEGWWDTHFRAQVVKPRKASQSYLKELVKGSDKAPPGPSLSLKECTFQPKIRRAKESGGASKVSSNPADEKMSAADLRLRKIGEFLERTEQAEAAAQHKLTFAAGEKAHDARVDRLKCPQCGKFRKYKELLDRKKFCSKCKTVRFKPALGEWFTIEKSFYGKLEAETTKLEKKKDALLSKQNRIARNGEATFRKGARVRVRVAKWRPIPRARRAANSGWKKSSSSRSMAQRSAEKSDRRRREREGSDVDADGEAADEEASGASKTSSGGTSRSARRAKRSGAPLFANFELGTVKFVNGDGSLDIQFDVAAMRPPQVGAKAEMRTFQSRVQRAKCTLSGHDSDLPEESARVPWEAVKQGFLERTAKVEREVAQRKQEGIAGSMDSECTFKPRLAGSMGAVHKSLQAHPELTREGRRDVVASERNGSRIKAVEKWKVFADTWDRVPLLKRVSAEERERLVKKIDIDGSDDEGAVTREGVDGAVVEIKHQTERMKRLLHRFKSDRHLRGDEQRSAAASKTKFKKAQTKSRVDFGKSGPPNAGLLQSELKACLAANEEVIDRAWAAKDEDALRAAMKTSEKLIGKLKRAEVQTHTAQFNPLVQQRYTVVAPDGCPIHKTASLTARVVGDCHSGDVVRTDAEAKVAWSGGAIRMVHLADDRGWIAMTDGDTGEELVEKVTFKPFMTRVAEEDLNRSRKGIGRPATKIRGYEPGGKPTPGGGGAPSPQSRNRRKKSTW